MDPKPKYIAGSQVWMMTTGVFPDLSGSMQCLICVTVILNVAKLRHGLKDGDDVIVTSKGNGR